MDFLKEIRAYALKNALEFGKVDASRILPKLFQHGLEKKDIKKIMPEIIKIAKEINSLNKNEQEKEFEKLKDIVKEREEKKHELQELPNVSKNMVFRIAPFPSGAIHIGNAKTFLLNALYAEKYNGKLILVMDDTIGSEKKPLVKESYKLIEEALQWLKVKYEKIFYKSDRLEIYYKYALELINKGKAYVCHCPQEELRKNREIGKDCIHRNKSTEENLREWEKMFDMKEGSAVLRIKTDMKSPNPAFRDRVLFKISDREHPRTINKYRVWPSLEMSWAIDDHLLGITHILRGNDLMIESDMEKYIWDIFSWKKPEIIHTGLVKIEGIEGAKLSKSKAQKEVKSGEFSGWDDPRTWSIQSLKRRGILTEAIREFIFEIGLNKQDISIPIESLYSINRKIIDSSCDRYVFLEDAQKIEVKGNKHIIKSEISISVHPDKPKETRIIRIGANLFLSKKDIEENKGKEIRLLHLCNIKLDKNGKKAEVTSLENKNIPRVTWVSFGVNARVLMPSGKWVEGIADEGISELKPEQKIQFERYGFCKFDSLKKENGKLIYEFWFLHG